MRRAVPVLVLGGVVSLSIGADARQVSRAQSATALAASVILLGVAGFVVIAFAAACGLAIGWMAARLLGGVTGDVFGASVEISEAFVLLLIASLAGRGWLDAWLLA